MKKTTLWSLTLFFLLKLRYSEKAKIFWKNLPIFLTLLSNVKTIGRFFSKFVTLSEYLNFTRIWFRMVTLFNASFCASTDFSFSLFGTLDKRYLFHSDLKTFHFITQIQYLNNKFVRFTNLIIGFRSEITNDKNMSKQNLVVPILRQF